MYGRVCVCVHDFMDVCMCPRFCSTFGNDDLNNKEKCGIHAGNNKYNSHSNKIHVCTQNRLEQTKE